MAFRLIHDGKVLLFDIFAMGEDSVARIGHTTRCSRRPEREDIIVVGVGPNSEIRVKRDLCSAVPQLRAPNILEIRFWALQTVQLPREPSRCGTAADLTPMRVKGPLMKTRPTNWPPKHVVD